MNADGLIGFAHIILRGVLKNKNAAMWIDAFYSEHMEDALNAFDAAIVLAEKKDDEEGWRIGWGALGNLRKSLKAIENEIQNMNQLHGDALATEFKERLLISEKDLK